MVYFYSIISLFLFSTFSFAQSSQVPFTKPPGESYRGELPALTDQQQKLARRLEVHVKKLSGEIGKRNVGHLEGLTQSIDYLTATMKEWGYAMHPQTYSVNDVPVSNLIAEIKGSEKPDEIIVIGAHYDSVGNSPAANDNGSGVAGVLEIARSFIEIKPKRTIRFVFLSMKSRHTFRPNRWGAWSTRKAARKRRRRSPR